jgi:hypothetical protein
MILITVISEISDMKEINEERMCLSILSSKVLQPVRYDSARRENNGGRISRYTGGSGSYVFNNGILRERGR